METVPLEFQAGHLFAALEPGLFLIDTGAPTSFGRVDAAKIDGREFRLSDGYMGLTPAGLSELTGVETAGLLGADILNELDTVIDIAGGKARFSFDPIPLDGADVPTDSFMGIPIIEITQAGATHRMFFDTGAQLSYLQDESLSSFPDAGPADDFYPGFGRFQTGTHMVPVQVGGLPFTLRCGRLPGLLGMTLMMAGVSGIVGNELLRSRMCGCFPRRNRLVLK